MYTDSIKRQIEEIKSFLFNLLMFSLYAYCFSQCLNYHGHHGYANDYQYCIFSCTHLFGVNKTSVMGIFDYILL